MNVNDSFFKKRLTRGWVRDLAIAGTFLTRLPFRPSPPVGIAEISPAVRTFPIIGLIVGVCGGAALWLAAQANFESHVYSLIGLVVIILLTGALHEDGLADFADGIGARDRVRRLEIMRDPKIGTFGVVALIFSIAMKAALLAEFSIPILAASGLIAAAVISRGMIPLLMYFMRPARSDGLGHDSGRPPADRTGAAIIFSAVAAFIFFDTVTAVLALALSAAVIAVVGWLAHRRLAGYTGDVLGAAQQCAEIAVLIVAGANTS